MNCYTASPHLALLLALLVSTAPALAQNARLPEAPASAVTASAQVLDRVPVDVMPPLDNRTLLQRDATQRRTADAPRPLRFAEPLPVDVTPATDGAWELLPSGDWLWRYRVQSEGARSLNFGFTTYHMPPGGKLWIYPAEKAAEAIGPFTELDNEEHGELWTPIVPGGDAIVEVTVPRRQRAALELELTRVNHAYRSFGLAEKSAEELAMSGSCNVDVVCPEGDDWRSQISSSGAYTLSGSDTCSGALVNNTSADRTPYFLTAGHCGITSSNASSMVVYWNYENSTCRPAGSGASGASGDGQRNQFNSGAIFRAIHGGGGVSASDMALVEMDDAIDPTYNLFFSGWSRADRAPDHVVTIHHPSVQEKRISFENDPTSITGYLQPSGGSTHIRVGDWDLGTTEAGSSGSPLYDENKRIVGVLSGGYAACGNNHPDWYGRFHLAWDGGGSDASRLSTWLDPQGFAPDVLDGLGAVGANEPEALETFLTPAQPNPFAEAASMHFQVHEAGRVRVQLYDLLGRQVQTLFNGTAAAGEPQTLTIRGAGLPSGTYVVHLTSGSFSATQPVTLVR